MGKSFSAVCPGMLLSVQAFFYFTATSAGGVKKVQTPESNWSQTSLTIQKRTSSVSRCVFLDPHLGWLFRTLFLTFPYVYYYSVWIFLIRLLHSQFPRNWINKFFLNNLQYSELKTLFFKNNRSMNFKWLCMSPGSIKLHRWIWFCL